MHRIETSLPPIHDVPLVDEDAILRLNPLGEGGYCRVESVSWNGKTLALKQLKNETLDNPSKFRIGFKDLATESTVLKGLDHPHIVKIHGVASGSLQECIESSAKGEHGFFVLMDQVDETLDKQLQKWAKQGPGLECTTTTSNSILNIFHTSPTPQLHVHPVSWNQLVKQRLPVALEIAQALSYLHKRGVMYRDLKPDNVGLNNGRTVKLLDFGLATTDLRCRECAGSRRYMAPEVVLRKHYTKAVDVYSFGILLWYLCGLEKPFETYTAKDHMDRVVLGGQRPPVPTWWPKSLQRLLTQCWSQFPSERPAMEDVAKQLQQIMTEKSIVQPKKTGKVLPITTTVSTVSA